MHPSRSGSSTLTIGRQCAPALVPDGVPKAIGLFDCATHALPYMAMARSFRFREAFEHHQRSDQLLLHYVIDGAITVQTSRGVVTGRRGDLLFSFPDEACDYRIYAETQVIHSHIDLRGAGSLVVEDDPAGWWADMESEGLTSVGMGARLILPDLIALDPTHEAVALLAHLATGDSANEPAGDLLRAGAGLRILAGVSRLAVARLGLGSGVVRSQPASHVRHAVDIIEQRISQQVSLQDLAQELGLDPDYLGRLFRQSLGISVGVCILRHRLALAQKLLRQPGRSIAAIAAAVGYRDPLYFARIFRRETGMAPRQWRQSQSLGPLSELSLEAMGEAD